jgi:hypothetical protein
MITTISEKWALVRTGENPVRTCLEKEPSLVPLMVPIRTFLYLTLSEYPVSLGPPKALSLLLHP